MIFEQLGFDSRWCFVLHVLVAHNTSFVYMGAIEAFERLGWYADCKLQPATRPTKELKRKTLVKNLVSHPPPRLPPFATPPTHPTLSDLTSC